MFYAEVKEKKRENGGEWIANGKGEETEVEKCWSQKMKEIVEKSIMKTLIRLNTVLSA